MLWMCRVPILCHTTGAGSCRLQWSLYKYFLFGKYWVGNHFLFLDASQARVIRPHQPRFGYGWNKKFAGEIQEMDHSVNDWNKIRPVGKCSWLGMWNLVGKPVHFPVLGMNWFIDTLIWGSMEKNSSPVLDMLFLHLNFCQSCSDTERK
jgi:hypothetical protein